MFAVARSSDDPEVAPTVRVEDDAVRESNVIGNALEPFRVARDSEAEREFRPETDADLDLGDLIGDEFLEPAAEQPLAERVDDSLLSEVGLEAAAPEPETVHSIVRVLEGGLTRFDDASHGEVDALKHVDLEEPSYLDVALDSGTDHLTLEHLCSHTPALLDRCLGCRHGKHAKSPSKRRPLGSRGIAIQSDDALESPFGACVHMDGPRHHGAGFQSSFGGPFQPPDA